MSAKEIAKKIKIVIQAIDNDLHDELSIAEHFQKIFRDTMHLLEVECTYLICSCKLLLFLGTCFMLSLLLFDAIKQCAQFVHWFADCPCQLP